MELKPYQQQVINDLQEYLLIDKGHGRREEGYGRVDEGYGGRKEGYGERISIDLKVAQLVILSWVHPEIRFPK